MANVVAGVPMTDPGYRFRDHPCASAGNGGIPELIPTGLSAGGCSNTGDTPILRIAEELDVSPHPEVVGEVHRFPPRADRDTQPCHPLVGRQRRDPTGSGMRSGQPPEGNGPAMVVAPPVRHSSRPPATAASTGS